jgi:hypothetical protein
MEPARVRSSYYSLTFAVPSISNVTATAVSSPEVTKNLIIYSSKMDAISTAIADGCLYTSCSWKVLAGLIAKIDREVAAQIVFSLRFLYSISHTALIKLFFSRKPSL